MIRPFIFLVLICMVSCNKEEVSTPSKTLVEFSISIEEFQKSPPSEFSQLPQIDQTVLLDLLSRDNPDHGTHIWFVKSKKGSELRLGISIYTPYERNGRLMSTGPMYSFKMKDGEWVLSSVSID